MSALSFNTIRLSNIGWRFFVHDDEDEGDDEHAKPDAELARETR